MHVFRRDLDSNGEMHDKLNSTLTSLDHFGNSIGVEGSGFMGAINRELQINQGVFACSIPIRFPSIDLFQT